MPIELVHKEFDLRLLQIDDGIIVQQHGREYLARRWQLTATVEGIIQTAIDNKFNCLWVDGHPLSASAHYMCFSRSHEKPWEFLIGGEANPPQVKCITINKKLRSPLSEISDDLIWQNFGGKHLFIEPDLNKLKWLISLLKRIPRENLATSNNRRSLSKHEQKVIGFQLEKHLEDFIFEQLLSNGHQPIRQPKAFAPNRLIEQASIPDIILEHENEVFIVELKPNATDIADLHQLNRYASNNAIKSKYKHKSIKPVLLAGFFHEKILEEEAKFEKKFELVSYDYTGGKVVFSSVRGDHSFYNLLLPLNSS